MLIQYKGYNNHSVMYDKEYIFEGSRNDIENQYKVYEVPDNVGSYLCKNYPEDIDSANAKGLIFTEVKKK